MNGQPPAGGLILGRDKPIMPEITIYPVADVHIEEGGHNLGDATHHLAIELPLNARSIHIPFNAQALRKLGRDILRAGGVPQPALDEKETP